MKKKFLLIFLLVNIVFFMQLLGCTASLEDVNDKNLEVIWEPKQPDYYTPEEIHIAEEFVKEVVQCIKNKDAEALIELNHGNHFRISTENKSIFDFLKSKEVDKIRSYKIFGKTRWCFSSEDALRVGLDILSTPNLVEMTNEINESSKITLKELVKPYLRRGLVINKIVVFNFSRSDKLFLQELRPC